MKLIEFRRHIRSKPIRKLRDLSEGYSSGTTDHSHDNKLFLDKLNIDSDKRLIFNNEHLDTSLRQEDW